MDWVVSTLYPPEEHFDANIYPKTYAWIDRYRQARAAALARADEPVQFTGEKAVEFITHANFTDDRPTVDGHDPTGLQQGAYVELFPTDGGGYTHQDRGRLVKLSRDEVAICCAVCRWAGSQSARAAMELSDQGADCWWKTISRDIGAPGATCQQAASVCPRFLSVLGHEEAAGTSNVVNFCVSIT